MIPVFYKVMKHYIVVKFKEGFDYSKHIDRISDLFNEAKNINGVEKTDIYTSNSDLKNRYDLMIVMDLDKKALNDFDNSDIHQRWKDEFGAYIVNKTIFDCD